MAIEMKHTGYQPNTALGVNLSRQKYGPLDFGSLFLNQTDFEYYISEAYTRGSFENKLDKVSASVKAKHPYPYVGQIISVVDGDAVEVYKLTDEQGGYERVGTVTLGDDVSIVKNDDDTLSIVGYADAEVGAIPKKTADGIVWEVPSTETVDGLKTAIGNATDDPNEEGSIYARIAKNKADIAVLNGSSTEEGSVAYQIAQILNDADPSDIDTLEEIADWIANHPDALTMRNELNTVKDQLDGIGSDKGSVKALIDAVSDYLGTLPEDATEETVVAHFTALIEALDAAKVSTGVFEAHTGNTDVHIQDGERAAWTSAKTIADKLDGDVNTEGSVKKQLAALRNDLEASIDDKVAKEDGKGLSTNDYTTAEKEKLGGIAEGAQVNVIEQVKVNGVALDVGSGKEVDITVPTGTLAGKNEVAKTDLAEALQLEIDDKLTKVTEAGTTERVYGVSVDGKTQKMMTVTNVPTESMTGTNVVTYNPTGTLTTLTPTDNNDAANKKYVDDAVSEATSAADDVQDALDEYIEANDAVIAGIKNGTTVNDFAGAETAIGEAKTAAGTAQTTIDEYIEANDAVIEGITGDIDEVSGVAAGNTTAIEGLESSKLAKVTTVGTTERVYSVSADGTTQSVLNVTNAPTDTMTGTNVVAYNANGTLSAKAPVNGDDATNKTYVDGKVTTLTSAIESNDADILALQGLVGDGFERIGDSTIQALFA